MKTKIRFAVLACLPGFFFTNMQSGGDIYITKSGWVKFVSEAPLEHIEAENKKVGVVINVSSKSIAFKVPINAFEGFNSALQHEHFNENYLEIASYPQATFTGKIIEDVDLSKPGTYKVRAKGMLGIHGIEKERIIPGTLIVGPKGIQVKTRFDIPLADHDISIPKIVYQKIAEIMEVEVVADLQPQA